jgi:predicted transcriptional regulator
MVNHEGMTTSTGIEIPSPPVPTEEEKHQTTLEALTGIDEGHVYSHTEVSAWLKSLGTANPLPRPHK